eukprot:COSAG02_NODE_1799_length_10896_cov_8.648421_4_plen_63_part_00
MCLQASARLEATNADSLGLLRKVDRAQPRQNGKGPLLYWPVELVPDVGVAPTRVRRDMSDTY